MSTENARLHELADAMAALMSEIDDQGGEMTAEQEAWLNGLEGTIQEKVDAILEVRRDKLDRAAANRAEAKRQIEKAVVRENIAERLKGYLMRSLETAGLERIETTLNRVRIQKSQPSVCWTGESDQIPSQFACIIPFSVELDKKAVVKAWKEKQPLPERIEVKQGRHLVID